MVFNERDGQEREYIFFNKISESSNEPVKASIDEYIDFDDIATKLAISERGIAGVVRRMTASNNDIPEKMLKAINNKK